MGHRALRKVGEEKNEPKLEAFQKAVAAYDWTYTGLKKKAQEYDDAARELQEAFQEVKQAHTESNCSNVAHNAKEDGQEPPQCAVDWKVANKDMKRRQNLAIPHAK